MTLSALIQTGGRAAWLGILILCLVLLGACSQTRTVTVPAQESSVHQVAPDTVEVKELPPLEPHGELTMAEEVIVYDDTSAPTFDVSLIEVDRTDPENQEVRIRVEAGSTTVEKRLAMPPMGEGLRIQAGQPSDTIPTNRPRDTPLQETVFGAPTEYQIEADVSEVTPPWWRRALRQFQVLVAFGVGAVVGYVVTKVVPGL